VLEWQECARSLGAEGAGVLSIDEVQRRAVDVSEVEGAFRLAKNSRGEDVLKVVDTSYIIVTGTGQEIQLILTRETKVPVRANPGDGIEAKISNEGTTLSVTRVEH
jgi:hypothetical protein